MDKVKKTAPESGLPAEASLTHTLGKNERVKDLVAECADDLSTVNAGLKEELVSGEKTPGVENALEKSKLVESKVQIASEALAEVNLALKTTLKDAPGFDKDHWPSMSDKTWASGVHKFYGTPYVGE